MFSLLTASLLAFSPGAPPGRRAPLLAVRTSMVRLAAPQPYRQDDNWNYYRVPKRLSASLAKPMGAVLTEDGGKVVVQSLEEGSSGAAELKVNDRVVSIMEQDVSASSFDEIMSMLASAPDTVQLDVLRTTILRKPRSSDDASLDAPSKGEEEQEPSKLDKAFAKNFGSAEATAKILQKTAKITANPTTWKNPIYFWSIAGTAVLFLPILFYVVTKD